MAAVAIRSLNQDFELSFCTFDFLVLGFLRNLPSVPWTEQFRTSAILTRKERLRAGYSAECSSVCVCVCLCLCLCVCVSVCLCVYTLPPRRLLLPARYQRILEGYGSTMLCCVYHSRCFCQVPSPPFLKMPYSPPKTKLQLADNWRENYIYGSAKR